MPPFLFILVTLHSSHHLTTISLLSCRYPNTTRKVLEGVSIAVTLNSRVAVIGANGAGKSTMIKLLTGELETPEGTVWKHPNLRVAYVAQHAFHHIEQHLDKTPNDYIAWRYASGEDREAQEKASAQVCPPTVTCKGHLVNLVSCSALHWQCFSHSAACSFWWPSLVCTVLSIANITLSVARRFFWQSERLYRRCV